jgi:hypothetical protein
MNDIANAQPGWAFLSRAVTNSYDHIEAFLSKLADWFWFVSGDVNSHLGHGLDRQRVNTIRGLGSRRERLPFFLKVLFDQPFSHLTPARITRTKKQNAHF